MIPPPSARERERAPERDRERARARAREVISLSRGLLILLAFLAAGTLLVRATRLPIPGNVLGMVLLTAALQLRLVRVAWVADAAAVLLRHLALFFVPPGVGLMLYFGLLRGEWLPIVAGAAVGTLAVLLVVGRLQQRLERHE